MTDQPRIERRLRISGLLLLAGLFSELLTLFWSHPTAFLAFLLLGGTLTAAGALFYLYSLVSDGAPKSPGGAASVSFRK